MPVSACRWFCPNLDPDLGLCLDLGLNLGNQAAAADLKAQP